MPIQEIIQFQKNATTDDYMRLQIALHCAPVLKGIKIANIMTVSFAEFKDVERVLKGTRISYYFLKIIDHRTLLFLYRKERIEGYLKTEKNALFLKNIGYENESVEQMIHKLAKRIQIYKNGEMEFPHEIGLFLGYPLSDVIGFMEDSENKFLYQGYWKVYDHLNSKLRLFQRYDESRERAVEAVLNGKTIQEIAV